MASSDPASFSGNKKSVVSRTPLRPGTHMRPLQAAMPVRPARASEQRAAEPEAPLDVEPRGWIDAARDWIAEAGGAYVASMLFHSALLLLLFLVLGVRYVQQKLATGTAFEAVDLAAIAPPLEPEVPKIFDNRQEDPRGKLNPDDLDPKLQLEGDEKSTREVGSKNKILDEYVDESLTAMKEGGQGYEENPLASPPLGGATLDLLSIRSGPTLPGIGGIGPNGKGNESGNGGHGIGTGYDHRTQGSPARRGTSKSNEYAVALALNWLARHQNRDGSWSLTRFHNNCKSQACSGAGNSESDAAATALALLPFLGAGNTHREGMYQAHVYRGVSWLISHQNRNTGDLSAGSGHTMYTHGLATIALCEVYGMTKGKNKDKTIELSAQAAINFIQNAQDKNGGGWRYKPGEPGDTSVVGWQVMALKSGQMAGLRVNQQALDAAAKYLTAASGSQYGGRFGYTPGAGATPTMSSVGLLCTQYLGAARDNPGLVEGTKYLMEHRPDVNANRNIYYWYYATQVMHNMKGPDWDAWDLKMRTILKKSQVREGCATGSWDPDKPSADAWGQAGGRVMMTSLSCLTLEVYYRYLSLYDLTNKGAVKDGLDSEGNAKVQ